jgi:HPt (histidine-containing phosphotransfer) domain-containing protein
MPDDFDPSMIELIVDDIGESAAREVLQLFFEDSGEKLDLLRTAADAKLAQRHARSLKSAAAAFGFNRLSALAHSLESAAYNLSASEIAIRAQSLGEALALARDFSELQ